LERVGLVCCQLPVHYVGTSSEQSLQFLECKKNSDLLLDRYKVPGLESHDFVLMRRGWRRLLGMDGWMDGLMDQGRSEFYQK